MKKLLLLAVIFTPSFAFAQSSGAVWRDGAVLTAHQLQQLDNAKINTSRIGVANGVAPLDANKMMSAPVSGDSSASPVTAKSSVSARSLSDRFSDTKNIKDFGIMLNGSDSTDTIKAVVDGIPTSYLIHIPAGKWNGVAPDNTSSTHSFFLNGPVTGFPAYILNNNVNQEHVSITDYGDGNTGIALNSKGGIEANRIDKTRNGYWPMATLRYVNANPLAGTGTTSTGLNVVGMSDPVGTGITVAQQTSMVSDGRQGGGAYDIAHQINGNWFGSNWIWNTVSQLSEMAGIDVGTVNGSITNTEVNLTGKGPEVAGSDAWPGNGRRSIYYINSWLSGLVNWTANTAVVKGKMVRVTDASGKDSLFVATAGGTTAARQPTWTASGAPQITDGTVTWRYLSPFTYQISKVFFLNKGNPPDNQYIHYGAMLASDADFYDAAMDFSKATYSGANPSVLRTKAGVGVDFTGDGTLGGQNNHVLSYRENALTYFVKGAAVLSVDDNGLPKYTVSNIAATGSTISDAYTMTAAINYVGEGASTGGVKPSAALASPGVMMIVKNATGKPINVYSIDGGWAIAAHAAGVPVVLPSHASLTLYRANLGANMIEADYHPAAP